MGRRRKCTFLVEAFQDDHRETVIMQTTKFTVGKHGTWNKPSTGDMLKSIADWPVFPVIVFFN